jgi:hypothetical protein
MLVNRLLIAITFAVGAAGAWTLWDATDQYAGVLRAYARVTANYQPDSFVWLDADYVQARATFVVTNASVRDATLESMDLHLEFDGEFAGSNYARFEPLRVPAGETRLVELNLTVTSGGKGNGGEVELALRGSAVFRFDDIQRSRTDLVFADIGHVPEAGP